MFSNHSVLLKSCWKNCGLLLPVSGTKDEELKEYRLKNDKLSTYTYESMGSFNGAQKLQPLQTDYEAGNNSDFESWSSEDESDYD